MASIREQIVDAVQAGVDGAGKPSGLTVHRSRARPIERDELPATVIYVLMEPVSSTKRGAIPQVDRTVTVSLEHRVSGNPPDTALDPLLVWGTKAMHDASLDGLGVRDVQERNTEWAASELDKVYGAARQDFEIQYRTREDDQEQVQ